MPDDNKQDSGERLIDSQLTYVLSLLSHELTEDQQSQVRERIKHSVELAGKVRATPMTNADEPEIVFQPFRRPERGS